MLLLDSQEPNQAITILQVDFSSDSTEAEGTNISQAD